MSLPSILCIDDDSLLLDFLAIQLESIPGTNPVVFKALAGYDGLQIARAHSLDLAIVDQGLPDLDGISVAKELVAIRPSCRVLILSGNLTDMTASRLLQSRVHGYLLKSQANSGELCEAVRQLSQGCTYFPRSVLSVVEKFRREPDHFSKILSDREMELLPFLGYGWSSERIARRTGISPATVRTHHQNILMKLNLHGREELMRWAIKKGFVDFRHEPKETDPEGVQEDTVGWSI